MIRVERAETVPKIPDVIITVDGEDAKELVRWFGDIDTPEGAPYRLWDALDDVVNLGRSTSVKGD